MPIKKPSKVLLHHIPLKFVQHKVTGGGKKPMNQEIPLVPFIDLLITLVVFLLMSFSASGELVAQQASITLPNAANVEALEVAPIIAIDSRVVTIDGTRVADTQTLASSPQVERIEQLIQALDSAKRNWQTLHPGQAHPGTLILQIDEEVDFLVIKKIMFSSAQAGFGSLSFAVNESGD
jgi:biopolymer transport protein ExbD